MCGRRGFSEACRPPDVAAPGLQNLTRHRARDSGAKFSPDGSQLVFVSDRGGELDLYLMSTTGAAVRRLER